MFTRFCLTAQSVGTPFALKQFLHNIIIFFQVGTFNSTGQRYRSHFSIWTTNKIQERLTYLEDIHPSFNSMKITGWVNGNLYVPTTEVIGILPIPDDVRIESGMSEYIPSVDSQQRHAFLAEMQGTHKPVLPVNNTAEKHLFRFLMENNKDYNSRATGPVWRQAVKVWNYYANSNTNVSYKVSTLCLL